MFSEEQLYSIALRRCYLIGDITFHQLVRTFGSAKEIWEMPKKEFLKNNGIGRKMASEIGSSEHLKFAEQELRFCEQQNIQILLRHQPGYPLLLLECVDAPAILYQKGEIRPFSKLLSIVGTRNMSEYGKSFINDFTNALKNSDFTTVSGLALGVDTEVHLKSIEKNIPTIAVLAHGFHTLYPSKNKKLATQILEKGGALLTEFNSSQKPDRENFIQRNRVIAGLSPSTLIVETAFGGGSVSTANFAVNYHRDVFALPGKITDQYSQGCNQLIFQNKAAAISTIKDLQKELGILENKTEMEELFPIAKEEIQLSDNQLLIYNFLRLNPKISLDEIAHQLEIPSYKILPEILELELLGKVKTYSGQRFSAL